MSDNVTIPFGDDPRETAVLLLGAAEEMELGQEIIRTTGDGQFVAPREVADAAGVEYDGDEDDDASEDDQSSEKKPAKKAAKKTTKKSG